MVGGGSIVKFAPNGTSSSPFASGLYLPAGLAVDSFDNLYVADLGSGLLAPDPLLSDEPDVAADGAWFLVAPRFDKGVAPSGAEKFAQTVELFTDRS